MEKSKPPKLSIVTPHPIIPEPDLTDVLYCQAQFQQAYEVPLSKETAKLYVKLIEEEHEEWVEDFYSHDAWEFDELKELADVLYVTAGLYYQLQYVISKGAKHVLMKDETWDVAISNFVEQIATGQTDKNTLLKLMYCLFSYADAMGWDLDEAYRRVHLSNMSKLDENGKPIRREDGKILKSKLYKEPYLEDLTNGK